MHSLEQVQSTILHAASHAYSPRSIYRFPIGAPTQERAVEIARTMVSAFQGELSTEDYYALIEAAWRASRGTARWILTAHDAKDMRRSLEDFIFENRFAASGSRHAKPRRVTFVFSGMGPQWPGMGRQLAERLPRFAGHIDKIDKVLAKYYGRSVWEELGAHQDADQLPTALAQIGNFLLQAAMFELLADEGIVAAAVVGHSAGEAAAAYAAGVYSLEDAAQVAVVRGELQGQLAGRGSMLAVGVGYEEAVELVADLPQVSIAAVNDDQAVTVAGDTEQIHLLRERLQGREVFAKPLRVEVPYHSPVMDEITDSIVSRLSFLAPAPAKVDFYSAVTGKRSDGGDWHADYWAKNVRQPVLFANAIKSALANGCNCFVEIAPHPVLSQSMDALAAKHAGVSIHHLLSRRKSEYDVFLAAICELAIDGVGRPARGASAALVKPVPAPQTLWDEEPEVEAERQGKWAVDHLSLLGRRTVGVEPSYEVELSTTDQPWIEGHTVQGLGAIVPATMWAELLALAVGEGAPRHVRLVDLLIVQSLPVQANPTIVKTKIESGVVKCLSRPAGEPTAWTLHAVASLSTITEADSASAAKYLPALGGTRIDTDALYQAFKIKGLNYSGHFRNLSEVMVGQGREAWAVVASREHFGVGLHSPWVLDAGLQLLIAAAKDWGELMYLPFRIGRVSLRRPLVAAGDYRAHAEVSVCTESELIGSVRFFDADGNLLAELEDVTCIRNLSDDVERLSASDRHTYTLRCLTPEEIAERYPQADGEANDETAEDASTAEESDSPEATARTEEYWLIGAEPASDDEARPFERPGLDMDAVEPDSDAHLLWVVPDCGLQADVLAAARAIQRVGQHGVRTVTLTLIGKRGQDWLFGMRRSAANSYGMSLRVILRDDATSSEMLQAAVALTSENEVIFETDEPLLRRLEQVTGSQLRYAGEPRRAYADEQHAVTPPSTLSFDFVRGQMKKLTVVREPLRKPGPGEICVEVEAVPLLWKDIGKVLGTIGTATTHTYGGHAFGQGVAGKVIDAGPGAAFSVGDRVFGAARRSYRQHITFDVESTRLLRRTPEGVDSATAVAHMIPWLTVLAAFEEVQPGPGATIFIQSGAGGLGSVLCLYASRLGARVVTSVGTEVKAAKVRKLVPEAEVVVARAGAIPDALLSAGFKGFDWIIATVTGSARTSLLSLLNSLGRYVDLGKPERVDESLLAGAFDGNKTYHVLDIDQLMARVPGWLSSHLDRVVAKIADPANHVAVSRYAIGDTPNAVSDMGLGKTTGCVAIEVSPEYQPPALNTLSPEMDPDGQYLITGGYGAVGLICAQWLSSRGARHIALMGSSGKPNRQAQASIDLIRTSGAEVAIVKCDVSDSDSMQDAVRRISAGGRVIRGAIHAAGLVADGHFDEVDAERIAKSFGPKLEGANHLVAALEGIASLKELDFILFTSSISSVIGLSIQGTYAPANAGLDGLAESLRHRGVNACAMQLGPVDDSGMAADENVHRYFTTIGLLAVPQRRLYGVLDLAVGANVPHFISGGVDWSRNSRAEPANRTSSLVRHIVAQASSGEGRAELEHLLSLDHRERTQVLTKTLLGLFTEALGVAEGYLNQETAFSAMGVDSLSVMDVQASINEILHQDLPLARMFTPDGNTGQLAARISKYLDENVQTKEAA